MSAGSVWIESRVVGGVKKYRVVWRVNGHRGRLPWTPLYSHALAAKKSKIAELSAGQLGVAAPQEVTFTQFSEDYLAARRVAGKAVRTIAHFDGPAVRSFAAFLPPGTLLSQVTPKMVEGWLAGIHAAGGRGAGSVQNTLGIRYRALRTAFGYAVRMKMVPSSAVTAVEAPAEEETGRALSDPEVSAILGNAPEELRRCATFALHTGLRLGEVMALDWKMVDRTRWIATIKSARSVGLEGSFQRKTRKGCRVPLTDAARAVMGKESERGRVFPFSASTVQHQLYALAERLELGRVRFHDFRHTFATRFLENGGSPLALLECGLWTNLESLKRYAHLNDRVLVESFGRVGYVAPTKPSEVNFVGAAPALK